MEDRLYRGFVAGIIGGIATIPLSIFSYSLGFTTLRLSDWAALLIFAHVPPFTIGEHISAILIHLGWSGAVGSIFAYFLVWVTSNKILFKGWLLGVASWFAVNIITTLFKVEGTIPLPLSTVISNFIISSVYGLVMGYSFQALDSQLVKSGNPREILAQPAAKLADDANKQHTDKGDKNN